MSENTDESKQHYIELENYVSSRGHLYAAQLLSEEWILPQTELVLNFKLFLIKKIIIKKII